MALQVIGAGLPRTATQSLRVALERLLGGRCYHMSVIPGHPFDLGDPWNLALTGGTPDWDGTLAGYSAAVDWPASLFWHQLGEANPGALIVLSERDSAETWLASLQATILPHARLALAPDWTQGRGLATLFEAFTGTPRWDDPDTLVAAYLRHNRAVRAAAPRERLLTWRPSDGWEPLCRALHLPVPRDRFPWTNRREDWS
ncbi:MAG TPA: sulfotransferase [Gemmatimonadales bacterium]|nr:sulfotransferase [Gemmatimonadales bacterium]